MQPTGQLRLETDTLLFEQEDLKRIIVRGVYYSSRIWLEQELTVWVVLLVPMLSQVPVQDGVAVNATVGARVIVSYVTACIASALRPITPFPCLNWRACDSRQPRSAHTLRFFDSG